MSGKTPNLPASIHAQCLSNKQERKLVDHVEEQLLEITRGFKKRNHPSTTLPTLSSYLGATHPLLSVILQIPPFGVQATLRATLLLRLTGDVLNSIVGYPPTVDVLPELLAWLDDLDSGWLAVLLAQLWDPAAHSGTDLVISPGVGTPPPVLVSQTDRARLRSLIVLGTERIEEWLEALRVDGAEDVPEALDMLGLRQSFEDMFTRTLREMGELA